MSQLYSIYRCLGDTSTSYRRELLPSCPRLAAGCCRLTVRRVDFHRELPGGRLGRTKLPVPHSNLRRGGARSQAALDTVILPDSQADELSDLLAVPEVFLGFLIIVTGLFWIAGNILLWDYQERRTDNPEDTGYKITPRSQQAGTTQAVPEGVKEKARQYTTKLSKVEIAKVLEELFRSNAPSMVAKGLACVLLNDIRVSRWIAGCWIFSIIWDSWREDPRHSFVQYWAFLGAVSSRAPEGARMPEPVEEILSLVAQVLTFSKIDLALGFLKTVQERRPRPWWKNKISW